MDDVVQPGPREQQLSLPDGRQLQVTVSGPDGGRTLLWLHGTPGSAHQAAFIASPVHARGWRLVTFSRPGYPGSTRASGRSVADVVGDASAVLDAVGARQALVAGVSGGGPHALACAALLPHRIAAALSVCSVAPSTVAGLDFLAGMGEDNVTEFSLALDGAQALRPFVDQGNDELRSVTPDLIVESLSSILPDVDKACITGDLGEQFAESFRAAAAGTSDGWLDDDLAFTRPWGFDLADVEVPVSLWQGDADLMVPFSHGQWLSEHIPGVHAHLLRGEGHLSITIGALEQMLEELGHLADRGS
jgi:pimeloyl-ACP methyl ester carboxylesterase